MVDLPHLRLCGIHYTTARTVHVECTCIFFLKKILNFFLLVLNRKNSFWLIKPHFLNKTPLSFRRHQTQSLVDSHRERTFQNMIGLHFCYWCIVVLCQGLCLSVDLRPTWWRHIYVFTVFFRVFFSWGFVFLKRKKKLAWEESVTLRGERGTKRDKKKNSLYAT
jgi:hypothetical protein